MANKTTPGIQNLRGSIGIGTSTPNRNLSVVGQLSIDNNEVASSTAGMLFSADTASNKIYSRIANNNSTALPFEIISGSSSSLYINTSGQVGIGTTNPNEELEVRGESFITIAVNTERNASGENIGSFAFYGHNNATTPENLLYSRIMSSMTDVTDGSENSDIFFQQINDGTIIETFRAKSSGTIQFPTYGAGYLRTDADGNVIVDISTVEDTLDTVTTRGNSTTNSITVRGISNDGGYTYVGANNTLKGFVSITSGSGTQKYKVIDNTNTTDAYVHIYMHRAYDYGESHQAIQEIVYQRRTTAKNFRFRVESDITLGQEVWMEFYEQTDGHVEGWVVCEDYAQVALEITYNGCGIDYTPTAATPAGTLLKDTRQSTTAPNWYTDQGGITLQGSATSDLFRGLTYPDNSFLRFDDDQTAAANMTSLSSIGRINYLGDTNNNHPTADPVHQFFTGTTDIDTATPLMTIAASGNVQLNAYSAGILTTDADGDITAVSSVATSSTLDDVTDNGNSTTNSIVVGGVGSSGEIALYSTGTADATNTEYDSYTLRFSTSGWDTNNSVARNVHWNIRSEASSNIYPDAYLTFYEENISYNHWKLKLPGRGSGDSYIHPDAALFNGNVVLYESDTNNQNIKLLPGGVSYFANSVGIGTTNAYFPLHVEGGILAGTSASTTNLNQGVWVYTNTDGDYRYGMDLGHANSRWRTRISAPVSTGSTDRDISFAFGPNTGASAQSDYTEAMVIRGDSYNVGIGTATPNAKLDVQGGDILAGGDIHIDNMGGYVTFYGNNSGMHSITSRDTAGDANDDIRINSYGNVLINLDSNNNNNNDAAFLIGRHGGANSVMQSTGLFVVREDGIITANGVEVVKPLPGMYMGASSITDEYLVLMQKYDAVNTNATGLVGKIVFQRGSTGEGNNLTEYYLNMQTAYNNSHIRQFKRVGDDVYIRIDEISIDNVLYYALKARVSGGGATLAHYFEGKILNGAGDSKILTRVRESDANVSVISVGVQYPDYEMLSSNYMQGSLGVGASTPSKKFHVVDSGNEVAYFQGTGNSAWIDIKGNLSELWSIGATSVGYGIYNRTDGAYRFNIDNDGNVGIGTTDPDSFLQVKTHTHYDYVHDLHQKIATFNPSSMSGTGSNASVNIGNGSYGTSGTENLYLQFLNTHGNYGYPVGWRLKSYTDLDATGASSTFAIQQIRRGNSTSANDGTQPHIDTEFLINQDGNVGIGTTGPNAKLHITGDFENGKAIVIEGTYGTDTTHYIRTHGVNSEELAFYSGTAKPLAIDTSGRIKVNNAFYLPTADGSSGQVMTTNGSGTLSWSNVTSSDTLDDVTDNGNSTTNSIVLGASTTGGTMLVRGTYTSGNIVVIGGMKSSGGAMIGYGVKPDTATNHGFVSSSAFTLERSAYYQQGNRHRWYAGASQDVAIGNAVTMSETMRLDFDKLGLSTSSPASLIHLGKPTNGSNIITFGEASIGGPHGLDFYGDDATRTKKYSIYYRTGTENISMETSDGTKRFEINQSGAVTFNEAFTFPTADGSAGAALVTNGSGSLSWNAGYQQYTPVGWGVLNNQTYTSTGSNISSNSTQAQAGTTPVQRNSATEFEATKAGWYEISYSFIVKNNYTNRAMIGAYMTASSSGGGGVIPGSHSTQYVRYSTYGEYAQIQNTFYYYTSYSSTNFYLLAYLLSGSMNMTTQAVSQSMISFRYINNDIT